MRKTIGLDIEVLSFLHWYTYAQTVTVTDLFILVITLGSLPRKTDIIMLLKWNYGSLNLSELLNWIPKPYIVYATSCVSILYLEVFLEILGIRTNRKIKLGVGTLILRNGKMFPNGTVHIKGNHFLVCWQARLWYSFYISYLLVWISAIFCNSC